MNILHSNLDIIAYLPRYSELGDIGSEQKPAPFIFYLIHKLDIMNRNLKMEVTYFGHARPPVQLNSI